MCIFHEPPLVATINNIVVAVHRICDHDPLQLGERSGNL